MKILKSLLIILFFYLFTGWELLDILMSLELVDEEPYNSSSLSVISKDKLSKSSYNSFTEEEITLQEKKAADNADLFLVKYNNSSTDIFGSETGYVVNSVNRSIKTEDEVSVELPISIPKYNRIDFNYSKDFLNDIETKSRSIEINESNYYGNKNYTVGDTESFYIIPKLSVEKYSYVPVSAELKYESQYSYIWYVKDKNYTTSSSLVQFTQSDFENLGKKFDEIYPVETSVFGTLEYNATANVIPVGNKVSILIFDINSDATRGQTSGTFGYFYAYDLYKDTYSNEKHIFYLDDYFTKNATEYIYSTLAHEFQHMLNHINKKIKYTNNNSLEIETWYTEMLSLISEEMLQETCGLNDDQSPKSRLDIFNLFYNKGFTNWRSGNEVYISYANAYAFGAFLTRNFGGSTLIKEIANNKYLNEESITNALIKLGYNEDFNSVCRKFAQVVIFTQNCTNNRFYSLNKKIEETNFTFYPIDLMKYKNIISNQDFYGPIIFSPYKDDGLATVGGNSFSVHYVGENVTSATYSLPISKDITMYTFACK